MNKLKDILYAVQVGVLRGWPGNRCPDCEARPLDRHQHDCPTGKWDGGVWG